MELGMSERVAPLVEAVQKFITERVKPVDGEFQREVEKGDRWTLTGRQIEILDELKSAAREQGLWNFWLTDSDRGYGLYRSAPGKDWAPPSGVDCGVPRTRR